MDELIKDQSNKELILENWLKEHETLPKQGSDEWLKSRKFRIGGSQISVLKGVNPYSNIRNMIELSLGITSFTGSMATRWGSILEDITENVVEQLFGGKNNVPGAIPHRTVKCHANSPDGVMYVKKWDALVLFEFKNPFGRVPGKIVPHQYKTQVKSGLNVIYICDFALFCDQQQKLCGLDELTVMSREINGNVHNPVTSRIRNNPIILTMLGLYDSSKTCRPCDIDDCIDYGESTGEVFGNALELVQEYRKWKVWYGPVYICNDRKKPLTPYQYRQQFINFCIENDFQPIGVIPLKTFRFNIVPVFHEKNYIEDMEPQLNEIVDIIRRLDPLTQKDQIRELNRLYPTKDQIVTTRVSSRKRTFLTDHPVDAIERRRQSRPRPPPPLEVQYEPRKDNAVSNKRSFMKKQI